MMTAWLVQTAPPVVRRATCGVNRLVQAPSTPQKIVRRARIALLAAEGKDNRQIAVELHTSM